MSFLAQLATIDGLELAIGKQYALLEMLFLTVSAVWCWHS